MGLLLLTGNCSGRALLCTHRTTLTLFSIDNIAVALYDNEICGILLYNKGSAEWDSDRAVKLLSDIIPDTENFRCVCEKYFAIEAKTQQAGHIELIACCTLPDFRGMGAGKKLIEWMTTEYNDYFINKENHFSADEIKKKWKKPV